MLADAREAHELSVAAIQGGSFEDLRVLPARRTVAEIDFGSVRALTGLWLAGSELAGLSVGGRPADSPDAIAALRGIAVVILARVDRRCSLTLRTATSSGRRTNPPPG